MSKKLRDLLLWVSLGLNVALLVGLGLLVAGEKPLRLLMPFPPGMRDPIQSEFNRIASVLDVSEAQRLAIQEQLDRMKDRTGQRFDSMRNERMQVLRAIVLAPDTHPLVLPDGDRFHQEMSAIVLGTARDVAKLLSPEQRKLLAEELDRIVRPPL